MKKAAKFFIVLGMVLGFELVFPIILGFKVLKKLNTTTNPNELRKWGLITLFLVSIIGGILVLILNKRDLEVEYDVTLKDKFKSFITLP